MSLRKGLKKLGERLEKEQAKAKPKPAPRKTETISYDGRSPHRAPADAAALERARTVAASIVVAVKKKDKTADTLIWSEEEEPAITGFIPTFPAVDMILGGGLPEGRMTEVFGPEASGKSAFCDFCILQAQRLGGLAYVQEYERHRDRDRVAKLGVDMSAVVFDSPDYLEQGFNRLFAAMEGLIKNPLPGPFLAVLDSLAAAESLSEFKANDATKAAPMGVAACMSRNLKKFHRLAYKCRAHLIIVNQTRDKIGGQSFVKQVDTPGGRAVKFYATHRLSLGAWAVPQNVTPKTGLMVKVRTVKNKIAPPGRSATWLIDYCTGPSLELSAWHTLLDAGKLKSSGAGYYQFQGAKYKRPEWVKALRADADLYNRVLAAVRESAVPGTVVPVEGEAESEGGEETDE